MNTISYTAFRENLADVYDHVEKTGEETIITRRGHADLILKPASEVNYSAKIREERFNASLDKIKQRHGKVIKDLADE